VDRQRPHHEGLPSDTLDGERWVVALSATLGSRHYYSRHESVTKEGWYQARISNCLRSTGAEP
jgi:hypothetical protein